MTSSAPLFRRYVALVGGLVAVALLTAGAIDAGFAYTDSRAAAGRLAREKAVGAAARIEESLATIARELEWATLPLPDTGEAGLLRRRFELRNLLRRSSAVMEARAVTSQGREQVLVSRVDPDRLASGEDHSADPGFIAARAGGIHYGPVRFVRGSEPWIAIAAGGPREPRAIGLAQVNLRFIEQTVARIQLGASGLAYAVDREGRLVAHPDLTRVLANTSLRRLPQVEAAIAGRAVDGLVAQNIDGHPVLAAAAEIPTLGWHVLVEAPVEEALAPALASVKRAALLFALGVLLAIAAGAFAARRLVRPIQALEAEVAARSEALARANEAKSRLLAVASHDLRQPMHALGLFATQLVARPLPSEAKRLAEGIEASVCSLGEMLDSALDLSRLEAGTVRVQVCDFALDGLLDSLRRTFEPGARDKGLRLRVRPTRLAARTDPALAERIAMNLVSNAIRYTSRGGVLVAARPKAGRILLQVWDTGPGIPEERRSEIFSEFVRLPGHESRNVPGLGLGLAIVERLAHILGARLHLCSRAGRGSCFALELPAGEAAAASRVASLAESRPFSGRKIAAIDDDRLALGALAGLLESWGCVVVTGASHDELLEKLRFHGPPDVLICDYRLRDGTGDAAIRRLREELGDLEAILVSGDTSHQAADAAAGAGLPLYAKPLSPMKLRAILTHVLAARAAS